MTTNNIEPEIDYSLYPHKVEVEGGTGCYEELVQISLLAVEWFGHMDGGCQFGEYNSKSGRCPTFCDIGETHLYETSYEYFNTMQDEFMWWDKNGNRHEEAFPEGDFTMLWGADHSHIGGVYTAKWHKKTGYDWGLEHYYFKNREDALYFTVMLSALNYKARLLN